MRGRVLLTAGLFALAVALASPTGVAGGDDGETSAAEPACHELHGSAGEPPHGSKVHGIDPNDLTEKQVAAVERDLAERLAARGGYNRVAAAITVDVYVHVITNGTQGNVSDAAIGTMLSNMNNSYAGGQGGVNTGITFQRLGTDRTDNSRWFTAAVGSAEEREMKTALHRGDASTLNIYTLALPDWRGYARFPWAYAGDPVLDGFMNDYDAVSSDTPAHEAGHWMGLYHTFQGGCEGTGDVVDDTPAEASGASGCPTGRDTCAAAGLDPVHNYMDYSSDTCRSQFTAGQSARMQNMWTAYRA